MDSKDRAQYEWIALRCQTGEPEAFEDLIAVMERPLLYYAASLTGNQDSGLDVLQVAPDDALNRKGTINAVPTRSK